MNASMPNFSTVKPALVPPNEWIPKIIEGNTSNEMAANLLQFQKTFGEVGQVTQFELNKIIADINNFKDHNGQICGLLVSISKA